MSFIFNQEGYLTLVSKKHLPSKSKGFQCTFCYYSLNVYWGDCSMSVLDSIQRMIFIVSIILSDGKNAFYVSVYRLGYLLKMHFLTIWTRIESFEVTFFFTGGNFLCAYACSSIFTTLKKCVSLTIPHFMYYYLMLQSFCDYKNHIKGILNLLVLISSLF